MNFSQLILSALAALIALTLHEYAHGYAAYRLGDDTAKSMGRLSLNPLMHLDPVGALCMIFFHFGWAKPVPINPRNFKNPKKGFAITALAGPVTNLLLGLVTTLIYVICAYTFKDTGNTFLNALMKNALTFLIYFFSINIGLGIFNLIPIPPFDGSRILNVILPERLYFKVMKYERQIYFGVIAWLFLGQYVYYALLSVPFIGSSSLLSGIAKIFSLSDILKSAINGITDGMIRMWLALPFFR